MTQLVYGVAQLNRAVRAAITERVGARGLVLVRGEIAETRVVRPAHGGRMVFFSLREGEESLSCVSFGRALDRMLSRDGQTGEVFDPPRGVEEVVADGRRVLCEGVVGTYTRGGRSLYQLSVTSVTDCGAGDRLRALRQLAAKLSGLGYFADERKRPLPPDPARVAVVTSGTGAVIHDFVRTAQDRGTGARLLLYDVRVQGGNAPQEIARAVAAAGRAPGVQVVVVIRGGGSEEDLACFNDEAVARAIFECPVPVVAGIGHETDHTLADMTADVRASTPTKAAQILWTPRADLAAAVSALAERARRAADTRLALAEKDYDRLFRLLSARSPRNRHGDLVAATRDLGQRLAAAGARLLGGCAADARNAGGRLATALRGLEDRERDRALACAGTLRRAGDLLLRSFGERVTHGSVTLERAADVWLGGVDRSLETLELRLAAASPLAPLERGFALVLNGQGGVVRSVEGVAKGDALSVLVADGSLAVTVDGVTGGSDPVGPVTANASRRAARGKIPSDAQARSVEVPEGAAEPRGDADASGPDVSDPDLSGPDVSDPELSHAAGTAASGTGAQRGADAGSGSGAARKRAARKRAAGTKAGGAKAAGAEAAEKAAGSKSGAEDGGAKAAAKSTGAKAVKKARATGEGPKVSEKVNVDP